MTKSGARAAFAQAGPRHRISAFPLERDRTLHGVLHFATVALGFEVGSLQLKIPFSGPVGIVDEHEMRVVLQTFSLEFHSAPVLLHKFPENILQDLRNEWYPAKQVPGSDHVNATLAASDWRYGCETGKPISPRSDRLGSDIG